MTHLTGLVNILLLKAQFSIFHHVRCQGDASIFVKLYMFQFNVVSEATIRIPAYLLARSERSAWL